MNNFLAGWTALDTQRKTIVVLAIIAAVACMVFIVRLATQEEYSLLYSGLEPTAAGEVIASLDQQQIPYQVRGNAIYVPASTRDTTRLALAGEGLPNATGAGYELLDSLTGFGTTSQMFDAAYWRAKEGELARTILAAPNIRAARVHIATPPRQPFGRVADVTASVTLTPAQGAIDPAQADAIRNLVAAAVSGLATRQVAVIDNVNGIIPQPGDAGGPQAGQIGDRAQQMKANLERLLAARVGPGKALVEVNIDADMDSQTITERVIDPTSRVAISSDLAETSESATGTGAAAVTVASNLPAGDADAGGQDSSSSRSETRERQNFEISETRRERVIMPGQIRRISVAVMLDGLVTTAADGTRSWQPRSDAEVSALRELVESAIGFDPARGDRVSIQTLEFPSAEVVGTEAIAPSGLAPGMMSLIQSAVLGTVALLLGLFVVRPLLMRPPALPEPEKLAGSMDLTDDALSAAVDPLNNTELEDPDRHKIRNLRELVTDRRDETAEVLRRWIDTPEGIDPTPTPEESA